MHTFRKLPQHSPRAKLAALRIVSKSAKCPCYQGLHDYRRFLGSLLSTKVTVLMLGGQVVLGNGEKVQRNVTFLATLTAKAFTVYR